MCYIWFICGSEREKKAELKKQQLEQKRAEKEKNSELNNQQLETNLIQRCFECESVLDDQVTLCEKCKNNFCSRCSSDFASAYFFCKNCK